jgi:hypothetical protein
MNDRKEGARATDTMTEQSPSAARQSFADRQTDDRATGSSDTERSKLTTADMVSAAGGQDRRTESPKYVEGEETPSTATMASARPKTGTRDTRLEDSASSPLFGENETQTFRTRWGDIQAGFVDEPRQAVEQADTLVAELMKRLAEVFADERGRLEAQWSRGEQADTEALRIALQRYRSFFQRLLSA